MMEIQLTYLPEQVYLPDTVVKIDNQVLPGVSK